MCWQSRQVSSRRTSRFGEWHFGKGVKLSLSVSSGQSSLSCSREKLRGGHLCSRLKGRPPPQGVTFRVMTHAKIVCQQFSFYFNFSLSLNPPFLSFVLVFFIFIFVEGKSYLSLVRFLLWPVSAARGKEPNFFWSPSFVQKEVMKNPKVLTSFCESF